VPFEFCIGDGFPAAFVGGAVGVATGTDAELFAVQAVNPPLVAAVTISIREAIRCFTIWNIFETQVIRRENILTISIFKMATPF
jgi:hypothetical protein